MTTKAR